MEVSLNHLMPGMDAVVVSVWACGALKDRLRGIGLIPGTRLHCVGRSGNGQVTALELGGACIRLQTRDLEKIRVAVPLG